MTNKESGLKKVQELVIRVNEQLPAYKKLDYNEDRINTLKQKQKIVTRK